MATIDGDGGDDDVLFDMRLEIIARLGAAELTMKEAQRAYDLADAELKAHDRVVAVLAAAQALDDAEAQPQRRDLKALVRQLLAEHAALSTAELCARIGNIKTSHLLRVLARLDDVEEEGGAWHLTFDPLKLTEAAC